MTTHEKSSADMMLPTSKPTAIAPQTWNHTYILETFGAMLGMPRLAEHLSKAGDTSPFARIAGTVARFFSGKASPSRPISPDGADFSGPSLGSLPARLPTLPTLDDKYTAKLTSIDMQNDLSSYIHSLKARYPRRTYLGNTTFETPSEPALHGWHKHFNDTTYLGLICKLDYSTGDVTVRLHPDDMQRVLEAGWGRQTVSSSSSSDEVILHAARDEADLEIMKTIIHAALGHVCGGAIEDGEDTKSHAPKPPS